MKRLFIPALSLTLAVSLVACGGQAEQDAEANQSSQVEIEVALPSESPDPIEVEVDSTANQKGAEATPEVETTPEVKEPPILEDNRLLRIFQVAYDSVKKAMGDEPDSDRIEEELGLLPGLASSADGELPDDYKDQYLTWRSSLTENTKPSTPDKSESTSKPQQTTKPADNTGNTSTSNAGSTSGTSQGTSGSADWGTEADGYFDPTAGKTEEQLAQEREDATKDLIGKIHG